MLRYQYNFRTKKHEVIETVYTKLGNKLYSQVVYTHNDRKQALNYLFHKTLKAYENLL